MNQTVEVAQCRPHPRNYNRHSENQVADLRASLRRFGQVRSVVVQGNGDGYLVVAGCGVWEAARREGLRELRADVIPAGWDEARVLAYLAADNELARQGLPDEAQLAALVEEVRERADVELARLAAGSEERLAALTVGAEKRVAELGKQELSRADVPDTLFATDNDWGIPTLDANLQARSIDLPVTLWGASARKVRMRGTWLFYCDDYRFEALWKDPSAVVNSQCVNAVEPNFTIGPQTPRAVALWQIYRKRWLARWWQSYGVRVLVDMNVDATTFSDIMLLGVPRGWGAYATRGYSERQEFTLAEYALACEWAGRSDIVFLLYGGGVECKALAQAQGWVWISEHMDRKQAGVVSG